MTTDLDREFQEWLGGSDTCRRCGCDDDHACAGGCFWVEPGLCSACAVTLGEQWAAVGEALRGLGRLIRFAFEEWVRRWT